MLSMFGRRGVPFHFAVIMQGGKHRDSDEGDGGEYFDPCRHGSCRCAAGRHAGIAAGLVMCLHVNPLRRAWIDIYRASVDSRGGAIALSTIRQILSDLVRDELHANAGKSPNGAIPRELVVRYVVGAYMAVLTWWLDGGAKLPPRQMDVMFRRLATEGIDRCRADLES